MAHLLASSSAGLDGLRPLPVLPRHRRFGLVRLLATRVDQVLVAAARPVDPCSVAAMPDRTEVARARPLLIEARELQLAPVPIYCQGVAGLVELLRDGGGPIYAPVREGALTDELVSLIAALQGRLLRDSDREETPRRTHE